MSISLTFLTAAGKGTSDKQKNNKKKLSLRTISFLKEVSLSASMTLEAAIVLPVFIFFFVNIMSAIEVIRIQSELEAALHQTGSDLMQIGYDLNAGESVLGVEDENILKLAKGSALGLYFASEVKKRLSGSISKNVVNGGIDGLSFASSSVMRKDDIIDIVVDYKVHPIFSLAGFTSFPVESRFYGRAFTGYDKDHGLSGGESDEQLVYVTAHGTVYHSTSKCRYLNPSISSVRYEGLSGMRNEDGSKYYPCEYCGKKSGGGNVFITPYGEKYHTKVDCPGLKRTIYTIPISEVGGRGPCSGCY